MSQTSVTNEVPNLFKLLSEARFEIGGEDQLADLHAKHPQEPAEDEARKQIKADWERLITELRIRTGTLLKTDTVSFLLGAGASRECGGPLIGRVPVQLEKRLIGEGTSSQTKPTISEWLECFYLAARRAGGVNAPSARSEILKRKQALDGTCEPLGVNLEELLSLLYRWRSALPQNGGRLRLDGAPEVDLDASVIEECLRRATLALACLCRLPADDANPAGFGAHKDFLRKVLTRPTTLKRANIFTLNYDTLVEQAADVQGVVVIDGFLGTVRRTFHPESYDYDFYFPAETTEGRVHRLDRVLHLYKLHGSITWAPEGPDAENPYGIRAYNETPPVDRPILIYPTPAKSGETLGMPYAELLRRFAAAVVRPQSVLFVIGYGFGDEHIRGIVRQGMLIPSFTLVIVDPNPQSDFVKRLREKGDQRVWIFSGNTFGTFSGFVRYVLPDLREEEIRRKVIDTYRALVKESETDGK